MSAETVVVRLLCEGGQLRPVGHRAVQESDLPEVKGRVLRFDVEGGSEAEVAAAATSVDYVTIADPEALVPFDDTTEIGARAVIAIACRIGKTRLIDNVVLGEDRPPA